MNVKPLNILVIDDEPELSDIIKDLIEGFGHRGDVSNTVGEAREKLHLNEYDAVFSDVHMPNLNGLQFLEDIQKNCPIHKIPIWVFITADAHDQLVLKASKMGVVDVIQKPFSEKEIENLLLKILKDRNPSKVVDRDLSYILNLQQELMGHTLEVNEVSFYTIQIQRRMRQLKFNSMGEYRLYFVDHQKQEMKLVFSSIIETEEDLKLFRWKREMNELALRLLDKENFKDKSEYNVFVPFVGSGEDLYSLAIYLNQWKKRKGSHLKFNIWGHEIDFSLIEIAKNGVYPLSKLMSIDENYIGLGIEKGHGETEGWIQICDEVFEMCKIEQSQTLNCYQNIKFDLVFWPGIQNYIDNHADSNSVLKCISEILDEGASLLANIKGVGHTPFNTWKSLGALILKKEFNNESFEISKMVKVVLADDSRMIRDVVKRMLTKEKGFEVVAEAKNGFELTEINKNIQSDVILLDINMPEMDGITWLELNKDVKHPPVVIFSSVNYSDAVKSLNCFEYGAVDYLEKPKISNIEFEINRIREVLRAASTVKNVNPIKRRNPIHSPKWILNNHENPSGHLIAIGASTGGVEALTQILTRLPSKMPPILVVIHIPVSFSAAFADRLNSLGPLKVVEAKDGMLIEESTVYIAPGGSQFGVLENALSKTLTCQVSLDEAPINFCKPSVEYMFNSLTKLTHDWSLKAGLLTGMGSDGAQGLLKLKKASVETFSQSQETCVVYGMPKAAFEMGAVDQVLDLEDIPNFLTKNKSFKTAS